MSKKSSERLMNLTSFHHAISLYEKNDMKQDRETLELLYALTHSGNLTTSFYIKDMLENQRIDPKTIDGLTAVSALTPVSVRGETISSAVTAVTVTTSMAIAFQSNMSSFNTFTNALIERLQSIPKSCNADYYLKASKIIQKLN